MQLSKFEKSGSEKNQKNMETQTRLEFQEFPCQDSIYLASCQEEFDWHFKK